MTNELTVTNKLTGVDYLGCIYNIYDRYASGYSVEITKQLFDLPEADTVITIQGQEYSYPKDAIGTPIVEPDANHNTYVYESIQDLYTEISVAGELSASSGLFSSEVSTRYDASYTSSSHFYHVEQSGYAKCYKLTLDLDYGRNNLDPDFENALYKMNAGELVKKYGTHFLYKAIFGGRWSYSQSFSKLSNSSSEQVKSKLEANYASYSASIEG